ncbi:activin receptor type-2B isoform X1 [Octopus bimaculoides]|uniref:activin receptor type-2B isoform X1 n=1 Tax=Octopus bimaculoides TaxID=37653 RepID=UPI0022E42E5D|nr:activin receptor type-2B isoform X1 [Octopus bimaculoides]
MFFIIKSLLLCGLICFGTVCATRQLMCEHCNTNVCNGTIECFAEPDKHTHCYATWRNGSDGVEILMKGCWLDHENCYNKMDCVASDSTANVYYCCCESEMCNQNISFKALPPPPTVAAVTKDPVVINKDPNKTLVTIICALVPIAAASIFIIVMFYIWQHYDYFQRFHRPVYREQIPTIDPNVISPNQYLPVQLLELIARGRFGAVWKASLVDEYVAVKVFPLQDRESWLNEQEIYSLPHIRHENILRFIAAKQDTVKGDLWLITEYHEKGSLCDFLKGNCISWSELCKIGESMARGLAFLHEDIPLVRGQDFKPAVAHRDFKSKNVLLKSDLTALIADFGLALKFDPSRAPGTTHGQVGTRRYMSPEILEGAITFTRDAFIRIDMYACGLILWELMSRCSAIDVPVDEYQLPFVEEIGLHPTLEEMQQIVVIKKIRPAIKESWRKTANMDLLCTTIEECWDQEADARLSAKCVEERFIHMISTNISTSEASTPSIVIMPTGQEIPSKESNIC